MDTWSSKVEAKLNEGIEEVIGNFDSHFFDDAKEEREKKQNGEFRKALLKVVREQQQRAQGPLKKAMEECKKFT